MKGFLWMLLCLFLCKAESQTFALSEVLNSSAVTSEAYQSFTFNGAWCWFSDPRAVYFEGKYKRTYAGWIDNFGDVTIGYFDHESNEIHTQIIYDNLEIDDHDNPSLLFDETGKLFVFFNKHSRGPLYQIKATKAESIDHWGALKTLDLNAKSTDDKIHSGHTYTNPIKLSGENGRIYLFWRGIDGKPSYSVSDDNGENWSEGQVFFMPDPIYNFRRPYVKVYSDGVDKIHFTFTDGHPRNEADNSIYYMYYQNGSFYKADGTNLKSIENLPVFPNELDKVYNGQNAKSWNWDIASNNNGDPIIAYTKYPNDTTHIYSYAIWNNGKWNNYDLVNSGKWFPNTLDGVIEPEPNYSGGMSIDHENPNVLYLSVNRDSVFEIEKWTTPNDGNSWSIEKLTEGSTKNNIRPFAIRGADEQNQNQLLWMQSTNYLHYGYGHYFNQWGKKFDDRFQTAIKMDKLSPPIADPLTKSGIQNIMRQTADWQLANPFQNIHRLDWHYGALYTGLKALFEVTNEARYKNELLNIGQAYNWEPLPDVFHADRLTVVDNWAWLYSQEKDPQMIDKSRWALDMHLSRMYKKATDVRFKDNPNFLEWWTWCDALFMAPPSFVRMWQVTGETKYLEYMNEQFWKTTEYLYSTEDSLFYRDDRYFDKISENDTRIFWSRGNGWVIAGLARMLEILPQDFHDRPRFEKLYSEMAQKLLSIQGEDGLWRVSLIDPEYLNMGESSGSSFFAFALAWGLNNNLIDQRYRKKVEKAWLALCGNVNNEGRLGFVQQVAGDPYPFYADQWQVYATGAFLLAGKEMHQMGK